MISLSTWHFFPSSAAARVACTGLCRCDGAQRQQSQEGQHGDGWAPMAEDESNSMESAGIHLKNRCFFFLIDFIEQYHIMNSCLFFDWFISRNVHKTSRQSLRSVVPQFGIAFFLVNINRLHKVVYIHNYIIINI